MAKLNFNPNEVADESAPLPAGDYPFMVIESDIARNKKNTGDYLKLVLHCLDEDNAGVRVYEYLNIDHPNEKVVQIAERQLAELCNAVGVLELEDTQELHDIPFVARLKVEAGDENFGPSNKVKKYLPA
jgi:hypothetical protein